MDTLALWSRSGLLFFFRYCSIYGRYHVCLSFFLDWVWTVQPIQPFCQPFKGKFHAKIMALFSSRYVCTSSFSYRKNKTFAKWFFFILCCDTHTHVDRRCVYAWRVVSLHTWNEQTNPAISSQRVKCNSFALKIESKRIYWCWKRIYPTTAARRSRCCQSVWFCCIGFRCVSF